MSVSSNTSIQPIDKQSVHQICSGQVVLDLATAVKELVENSLDAGADSIEIKLWEHGKKLIEVSDNGSGINENDFESVALKHCTSKLSNFGDLMFVNTFGFRGEALSSLSAVSELSLTTKDKHSPVGTKLEFDRNGKISEKTNIARERGTTVSVKNLFHTLPVRFKDFEKNYKREFGKLVNVLYSYALINKQCRFKCTNVVKKNKYVVIATGTSSTITELITNLFGINQTKNLVPIAEDVEITEALLEEYNLTKQASEFANMFTISGFISDVTHGHGRSCPDRQYFFINKRPCDYPKLSRTVNEVYHQFNKTQYPFVFMEISLKKEFVDVNITPDKRKIMIHREKILFARVKATLKSMFETCASLYRDNTSENVSLNSSKMSDNDSFSSPATLKEKISTSPSIKDFHSPSEKFFPLGLGSSNKRPLPISSKLTPVETKMPKLTNWFRSTLSPNVTDQKNMTSRDDNIADKLNKSTEININTKPSESGQHNNDIIDMSENEASEQERFSDVTKKQNDSLNRTDDSDEISSDDIVFIDNKFESTATVLNVLHKDVSVLPELKTSETNTKVKVCEDSKILNNRQIKTLKSPSENDISSPRRTVNTAFDIDEIRKDFQNNSAKQNNANNLDHGTFYAKISPGDNKLAEGELRKHISKESFEKMKIIGQFNHGFIIAKYFSDIFIIDQHATDEKYNFEKLQKERKLKGQKLIKPIRLDLNCVDEDILLRNMHIFQKNGFEFDISQNKENTDVVDRNILLTTVPSNKNWTFGVSDIEEMIFMLSDSPGVNCRPSRIRAMFASQACRKSVMIGTPLDKNSMVKLLSHMSEIEHPWNCPHGRPTMRHLVNILRVKCEE